MVSDSDVDGLTAELVRADRAVSVAASAEVELELLATSRDRRVAWRAGGELAWQRLELVAAADRRDRLVDEVLRSRGVAR